MSDELSDQEVAASNAFDVASALDECAKEPVHTPGAIQPIGVLLGCQLDTGKTVHASANATDLFSCDISDVLGRELRDLLGADIWHAVNNFAGLSVFSQQRLFAGVWAQNGSEYAIHVSMSSGIVVVEIESAAEMPATSPEMLREQTFMISQIQACEEHDSLFDLTCRLLRHVTGFDRVMIYKFDSEWNGQVLAEARKASLEPFVGLHFPHWDVPEQARAIMARIKLRLIEDIDYAKVPLVALSPDTTPLDISLAQSRAVSPIHLQYLRNMGTRATMTLSVVVNDTLWGIISFHHERPRLLSSEVRQVLTTGVLPVFCLKLDLLGLKANEMLSRRFENLQSDIQTELELGTNTSTLLDAIGPTICETLDVAGLVVATGSQNYAYGCVPQQALLQHLVQRTQRQADDKLIIESLSSELPEHLATTAEVAGVLAIAQSQSRCLLLFRREAKHQDIVWAGNPSKTIKKVDGQARLEPRGSFSSYLEIIDKRCKAWSDQDQRLARQLWPLLSTAERREYMESLSRQQNLMINELNHRVRNILALVKSVSQRASRDHGTLQSYSQALESRIMALAAAHEIGAGSAQSSVSIRRIIALEAQPFDGQSRFFVTGHDFKIKADIAPILALVIHELTTNAVKHGALSTATGRIDVKITKATTECILEWTESNGPNVRQPSSMGFGTTLIQHAVPYELNGLSTVNFAPNGLQVVLTLPASAIHHSLNSSDIEAPESTVENLVIHKDLKARVALILEDNFMIATDMEAELAKLGFVSIQVCASADDALAFLETSTPGLALLDLNLGQGKTSLDVATELVGRGVPTVFVTGYGDTFPLPPHLDGLTKLIKPVSQASMQDCLLRLVGIADVLCEPS